MSSLQGRDGKAAAASLKAACLDAVANSKARSRLLARACTSSSVHAAPSAVLALLRNFRKASTTAVAGSTNPSRRVIAGRGRERHGRPSSDRWLEQVPLRQGGPRSEDRSCQGEARGCHRRSQGQVRPRQLQSPARALHTVRVWVLKSPRASSAPRLWQSLTI